jgi:hypothetical protein
LTDLIVDLRFTFERATKNKYRFEEAPRDGEEKTIGTMYFMKEDIEERVDGKVSVPSEIWVTVRS